MGVTGTGAYQADSVSGVQVYGGIADYDYFSGILTTNASGVYPISGSGDENTLNFGPRMREIQIFNTGANDLAFQWPRNFGKNVDNGIVKAGASLTIRTAFKYGMKVRSVNAAATTTYYVIAN